MKKILILPILIVSLNCFAQRVTLGTLMKVQNSSILAAEDLCLSLGFVPAPEIEPIGAFESYQYSKNSSTSKNYMNITKNVYKNLNTHTSFFTLYLSDYNAIKKDLLNYGYQYLKTEKEEGVIHHKYANKIKGYEVTFTIEPKRDGDVVIYFIDITNRKNYDYYLEETQ
jgi:hypothetical protein